MRHLSTVFAIFLCLLFAGCPLVQDPIDPLASNVDSTEPLLDLVTRTLDENLHRRVLSTNTHGAWQILHGVLAYGAPFTIETLEGERPAIEYLLEGNPIDGFDPIAGDLIGDPPRPGLRIDLQPGTKTGQGHRDQWLAVLAQCGLPLHTELSVGDRSFQLADWLQQAEYDVPRNLELEFSWTLIALTSYRDTDHRWTARDGIEYSTQDLLESELQQSLAESVCGGTHRLIGIAMSLNKRRNEGQPVTGVWANAETKVREAITLAEQNQNPDGSYSVAYLHRPGWTRDLGEALGTTGHVLEFLAFAASDQTLRQPWVERSVRRVCQILDECREVDLECGVLYHALHGLSEFRDRLRES